VEKIPDGFASREFFLFGIPLLPFDEVLEFYFPNPFLKLKWNFPLSFSESFFFFTFPRKTFFEVYCHFFFPFFLEKKIDFSQFFFFPFFDLVVFPVSEEERLFSMSSFFWPDPHEYGVYKSHTHNGMPLPRNPWYNRKGDFFLSISLEKDIRKLTEDWPFLVNVHIGYLDLLLWPYIKFGHGPTVPTIPIVFLFSIFCIFLGWYFK
jgi:hypothetical protein